jgi:cytochrome c-type biogenesis protein CcmH
VRPLLVAVAALVLAAPASACAHHASQSTLETLLVCPQCHETLDESNSPVAQEMKAEVARRIAGCETQKQILDAMVAEFGTTILSTPQTHGFDLLAWVLPLGGAALGAAVLAGGAWKWSRVRTGASAAPGRLSAEDEQRVDEALARFDG